MNRHYWYKGSESDIGRFPYPLDTDKLEIPTISNHTIKNKDVQVGDDVTFLDEPQVKSDMPA